MSVEAQLIGDLGNNLFQYAIARIISERHGFELNCHRVDLSPHSLMWRLGMRSGTQLADAGDAFPNAPLHIPGMRHHTPQVSFDIVNNPVWNGHSLDLKEQLDDPRPRQLLLAGYFQRYEYVRMHRDTLKQWFKPVGVKALISPSANDVLVSVRRGVDFRLHGWTLSPTFYQNALSGLRNVGRVYMVGTGIDREISNGLSAFEPTIIETSPVEQLALMLCFNRIILANCPFAWWGGFLSDATELYGPSSTDSTIYAFTGRIGVDLKIDEARYHEVEAVVDSRVTTFAVREEQLFRLRTPGGPRIVMEGIDIRPFTVEVADSEYELICWIVDQKRPVTLAEMRSRYPGPRCTELISRLLQAKIMTHAG